MSVFNIFKKVGFVFALKILGTLLAFLVTLEITNRLSIESAGFVLYIISLINFFSVISRGGLDNVIVKLIGKSPSDSRTIDVIKTSLPYTIGLSLTFSIVSIAVYNTSSFFDVYKTDSNLVYLTYLTLFAIIPLTISQSVSFAFQARNRTYASTIFFNVSFNLIFYFSIAFSDFDVESIYRIFIISAVTNLLVLIFTVLKSFGCEGSKSARFHSSMTRSAIPLWLVMLSNQGVTFLPIFFGGLFLTQNDLALMAVSHRISLLVSFALLTINYVTAPLLVKAIKDGDKQITKSLVSFISFFSLSVSFPIVIAFYFFNEEVLSYFGNEYKQASHYLMLLILAQFFNVASGCVNLLIIFNNKESFLRNVSVVVFFLALISYGVFMPVYGIVSAGLIAAGLMLIKNLVLVVYVYRKFGIYMYSFFRVQDLKLRM